MGEYHQILSNGNIGVLEKERENKIMMIKFFLNEKKIDSKIAILT